MIKKWITGLMSNKFFTAKGVYQAKGMTKYAEVRVKI